MINFKINPVLIFTPASKPERFNKAIEVGANGIILDLEDSVSEKDKESARDNIFQYLSTDKDKKIITIIRINQLTTQAGLADLLALARANIYFDALLYPKTESPQEINLISEILAKKYPQLPIIALIETGKGLTQINNIVEQSPNLTALMFGAADYAVDINCDISLNALMLARMQMVQAASLRKIASYDSPYFDFHDDSGLITEVKYIKELGFTGKAAIHPQQVETIKKIFKPSDEEYQYALAIIKTYEAAKGEACQYKGKMIDVPVFEKAKQIVAIYNHLR